MPKKIMCAFGTDIDSVAGWIGSPTAAATARPTSSAASSRPRSASRACCGCSRRYDLKTSFFIPGHSLETFPKEMEMIVDAGHEVGAHGYLHENPVAMTPHAGRGRAGQVDRADRGR